MTDPALQIAPNQPPCQFLQLSPTVRAVTRLVLNAMIDAKQQLPPSLCFIYHRAWAILAYVSDFSGDQVRTCRASEQIRR